MATPQSTYGLDRRSAHQPAYLADSDLYDEPSSSEWPFDSVPDARASLDSFPGTWHPERSATPPPRLRRARRRATAAAMVIAGAMIMTFGAGWWVGGTHASSARDEGASVARVVRGSAKALRAEAQMDPVTVAVAMVPAPQAPTVPVWRSSPVRAAAASVGPVVPVASVASASVAAEKPAETAAPVFVPTEL